MYSVYTLTDPRDNLVRYVGISNNVQRRFLEHFSRNDGNEWKISWIQELKEASLAPVLEIIASGLTYEEAQNEERNQINYYLEMGVALTNRDGITRKHANRSMREVGLRREKTPRNASLTSMIEDLALPVEIAQILQVTEQDVEQMLEQCKIPGYKFGRGWLVSKRELQEHLAG